MLSLICTVERVTKRLRELFIIFYSDTSCYKDKVSALAIKKTWNKVVPPDDKAYKLNWKTNFGAVDTYSANSDDVLSVEQPPWSHRGWNKRRQFLWCSLKSLGTCLCCMTTRHWRTNSCGCTCLTFYCSGQKSWTPLAALPMKLGWKNTRATETLGTTVMMFLWEHVGLILVGTFRGRFKLCCSQKLCSKVSLWHHERSPSLRWSGVSALSENLHQILCKISANQNPNEGWREAERNLRKWALCATHRHQNPSRCPSSVPERTGQSGSPCTWRARWKSQIRPALCARGQPWGSEDLPWAKRDSVEAQPWVLCRTCDATFSPCRSNSWRLCLLTTVFNLWQLGSWTDSPLVQPSPRHVLGISLAEKRTWSHLVRKSWMSSPCKETLRRSDKSRAASWALVARKRSYFIQAFCLPRKNIQYLWAVSALRHFLFFGSTD